MAPRALADNRRTEHEEDGSEVSGRRGVAQVADRCRAIPKLVRGNRFRRLGESGECATNAGVLEDFVERDGGTHREATLSIDIEAPQAVDALDVDEKSDVAPARAHVDQEIGTPSEDGGRWAALYEKARGLGQARGSLVVEAPQHPRLLP
jgi:hypothetical protein